MIQFVNPNFQSLCGKEWIVTNGLGGYASGSLSGANTRRYHGLLVAAINPPTQRMVLVSKVEETVAVDGAEFELSANQFQQAINPQGYQYLESFERFPFPKSTYKETGFVLSKTIFMVHGENTTVVTYKNEGGYPLTLKVAIFLNYRDYHGNMRENQHTNFYTEVQQGSLKTFLNYLDSGMLPNRFPDAPEDEIEYNTIDATLWLFVVLYEYHQKFEDDELIRSAFGKLTEIIHSHKTQTRYNIHETPEGFIYGGEGIAQLTWMDARIGDVVVTPRHGCPVEIQALWYNALKTYQYFQQKLDLDKAAIDSVNDSIHRFETHFVQSFFNEKGYLNDVVVPNTSSDDALRCNQIYAVSLPFSILDRKQQKKVVDSVTNKLLTPFGLRTLEPNHPDFKPTYGGDVWSRDLAYHQGTVWPFLMSEYAAAYLKVYGQQLQSKAHIESLLGELENHFYNETCIGGISEVFDGLDPKQGKGTIQQAWSVSALIKILYLIQKP